MNVDLSEVARRIVVPHMPMLGPVHPDEISEQLVSNIVRASQTGTLLPYDKQTRWASEPTEKLIDDGIELVGDEGLVMKTKTNSGKTRAYVYGTLDTNSLSADELVVCSLELLDLPDSPQVTVLMMDNFSSDTFAGEATFAHTLSPDVLATIVDVGDDSTHPAFDKLLHDGVLNDPERPTIVVTTNGAVAGAIGPHSVLPDSRGTRRLLPCYFGVNPALQRGGVGGTLWNMSRTWAKRQGAKYTVLQAVHQSPAQHFYESMGLATLGYVHRRQA